MEEESKDPAAYFDADTNTSKLDLATYHTKFDEKAAKSILEDSLAFIKAEVKKLSSRIEETEAQISKIRKHP
jgi:hypothetical protein